jgi:phage terminase large subunit-like protein
MNRFVSDCVQSCSAERTFSAELFMLLPKEEREARLAALTPEEAEALLYDWDWWARDNQLLPGNVNPNTEDGSWTTWLVDAGRGFGKTRVGAETVKIWARDFEYVNLVGATADDARDIMIEGESGILAICSPSERPLYIPSKRQLLWPNGAKSLIFTADEPERLRGKQHMKAWADEVAAWRYRDAWDQLMFGLRLGSSPQVCATTTPKNTELIRELINDPTTIVTRGTTYDNKKNLAPAFYSRIIKKYEGTRLGRQELNAELLTDNPGALWNHTLIDKNRVKKSDVPEDLSRIVVGVDPAVTSGEESDETGIVVAARDNQETPHFYIFDDASIAMASPNQWAQRVVDTYRTFAADRIIGEVNNGGDLVEAVIRNKMPFASYEAVRASRGKIVRAEPIAALYEQGRVHHVGSFPMLEDQMCDYDPNTSTKSPDRMDALVWALTQLSGDDVSPEPVTAGSRMMS